MKFFEAVHAKQRLHSEGYDAVHLECHKNYGNKASWSVVFKSRAEADDYRLYQKNWDIEIYEIR